MDKTVAKVVMRAPVSFYFLLLAKNQPARTKQGDGPSVSFFIILINRGRSPRFVFTSSV